MRMKKGLTILAALLTCAALCLTAERAPRYDLTEIAVRRIDEEIEITGSVSCARSAAVSAQLPGTVSRVFAQEGERVQAGQALLELEAGALALSWPDDGAQSAAERAEAALQLATITAPADGILRGFSVEAGKSVYAGEELGRVVSADLVVTALLPESQREDVRVGLEAEVARGERTFSARIAAIENAPGASAQYALRLEGGGLAALEEGMQVDVTIPLRTAEGPSVPLQALQADGTLRVLTEEGEVCVPVETGLSDALYVQLLSGPPLGTDVILGEAGE